MSLSGKKKQGDSVDARKTNANGVVITVYVESIKTRTRKTKTHSNLRNAGSQGYDRRALLLAYSQQLRNAGSKSVPLITNQPRPKIKSEQNQKGTRLNQPVRICSSDRCRNEPVASTKESKEGDKSNKRKSKSSPPFLGKMKNIWKQLSCKEI